MIKRLALSFVLLFSGMWAVSQNLSLNKDYLDYIEKYYQLAVRQQKEYGIPASITLAQGLLESSAGKSTFAVNTNNHFGIKCHDWKGDTYYMDDDEKNECFRKYDKVIDSYEDHSSYLKSKPRYSSLFQLNPTDYKGWAAGLKKAGYATDPSYATKLITLIENYQLNRFDQGKLSEKEVKEQDKTIAKDAAMGIISASARHMGVAAYFVIWLSNASVAFLVVLYSINVFITFSLSQYGMVKHWLAERKNDPKWFGKLLINGIGLLLTLFILITVVIIKFHEQQPDRYHNHTPFYQNIPQRHLNSSAINSGLYRKRRRIGNSIA